MKPLLIYDGDCGFCRYWIARWKVKTSDQVEYQPYQEVFNQYPQISLQQFQSAVQFIDINKNIYSGAEAVLRLLSIRSIFKYFLWI